MVFQQSSPVMLCVAALWIAGAAVVAQDGSFRFQYKPPSVIAAPTNAASRAPSAMTASPPAPAPGRIEPASMRSGKKGLGGWQAGHRAAAGAAWYYNWGPYPDAGAEASEFVPMIKGAWHVNDAVLASVTNRPGVTCLLGFNEPERKDQGNVTVERAVELWPKLMATGLRLGSPAPSSDAQGMAWLERFMEQAEKNNLRVDFIAVHWYRDASIPAAGDEFEEWLRTLHRKYRRPIWVTEFAGMNWGFIQNRPLRPSHNLRFLRDAMRAMERLDFVERYAWFSTGPGDPASLFESNDPVRLSELGRLYRDGK